MLYFPPGLAAGCRIRFWRWPLILSIDNLTDEQRQHEIDAFYKRRQKMIFHGKIIAIFIAVYVIIGAIANMAVDFGIWTFFGAVFNVSCAVAFVKGVTWVRYFFIAAFALNVLVTFSILADVSLEREVVGAPAPGATVVAVYNAEGTIIIIEDYNTEIIFETYNTYMPLVTELNSFIWVEIITLLVMLVLNIICIVVLIINKNVKEYMYAVKHG